jgi:hypothetical protein
MLSEVDLDIEEKGKNIKMNQSIEKKESNWKKYLMIL